MNDSEVRVYGYRWVVLLSYMLVAGMTQVLWITFAPITSMAAKFYGTSDMAIGLLSLSFMAVYVLLAIPAAWLLDTKGCRTAVGLGAVLCAVFAVARGVFASRFPIVLAAQLGIAIGQPFILGATTKLAAQWFPIRERATATGLGMLASYLGIVVAMVSTPALALRHGIPALLVSYGIAAAVAAIVFLVLARANPPTPACAPGQEVRSLVFDGLKQMLRQRSFLLLIGIFFIGLGIFNAVSTWIEDIVRPRGFTVSQAGMLGGLMLLGGILGAATVPIWSDKVRRRKPFILAALVAMIPSLFGITYARSYGLLLVSGVLLGFFLLSAGPIGFQFGAEMTYPAPEGTSNNMLQLMGQGAGVIFILAMDAAKSKATGSMTVSLLVLIGLTVLAVLLCLLIREKPLRACSDVAVEPAPKAVVEPTQD